MTTLHTLPRRVGRRTKRVGRGHGSGRGTYAARGIKGQRSRTGGRKGNIRRALSATLSKLPKQRGFRSTQLKYQAVNIALLEKAFATGDKVTPEKLATHGFATEQRRGIKILGDGALTKALTVSAHAFSRSAERAITKAGGTVVHLKGYGE